MMNQDLFATTATGYPLPLSQWQLPNNTAGDSVVNSGCHPLKLKDAFVKDGYFGVRGILPSQSWLDGLYALYDQLILNGSDDPRLQELEKVCNLWRGLPGNVEAFAGAPVGFRDRREREGKEQKTYFQYNLEFGHFLQASRGSIFYRYPLFRVFCQKLSIVANMADTVFRAALQDLTHVDEGISHALWGHQDKAAVHIKMLRYEPDADWATQPHFDKSALTLVVNADDISDGETFRVAPYKSNITAEELRVPDRRADSPSSPSIGLLFPGMCLRAMGGDIQPSPHGVLPLQTGQPRHALIAFLMTPGIHTEAMDTNQLV